MKTLLLLFLLMESSVPGQQNDALKVTTVDGGSVITPLLGNIKVNKGSTLHRAWMIINDPSCPVQMTGAGIKSVYESERGVGSGDYRFRAEGSLTATDAVAALDITFILYDPFGEHLKTLGSTYVEDLAAGSTAPIAKLGGSWYASENEVSELLSVVAFVSKVRTSAGAIWLFNSKAMSAELSKIHLQATSGVLEPTPKPKTP